MTEIKQDIPVALSATAQPSRLRKWEASYIRQGGHAQCTNRHWGIALSRAVQLTPEISRANSAAEKITVSLSFIRCLIALLTTAIWGAILYFGTRAIGIPIGIGWLTAVLGAIFLLLLVALSLAVLAADTDTNDQSDPPPVANRSADLVEADAEI